MKSPTPSPLCLAAICCASLSAIPVAGADEAAEEISNQQAAAYVAAFDKRDPAAMGALFTEEAEYTVDEGDVLAGREAIAAQAKEFFDVYPDAKLEIVVESARFVTDDVILEKGIATVIDADSLETTRYTATQVKKDGKWLLAELQETTLPSDNAAAEALSSLDWIIGKWKVSTEGIDAETEANWTLDGHFITRTTQITREGEEAVFISVEVIGYNPADGQIQSWIVDNEGGFGNNLWRRDGNKWLVVSTATGPDGSQSSCQHILTVTDGEHFEFETINRVLDGEALPNRDKIELARVAGTQDPTPKQ